MSAGPVTTVELHIKCSNLKNMDVLSKSDPCCLINVMDRTGSWREAGRTEIVKNNLNPVFVTPIRMPYFFEEVQRMVLVVGDIDAGGKVDKEGDVECTLAEIVCARPYFRKPLGKGKGEIIVTCEELKDTANDLFLEVRGDKLDKKDLFGKSDPFLVFSQIKPTGEVIPFHKTEVIKNTLNPVWKPISLPLWTVCSGDMNRQVLIECFDWDSDGKNDFIGNCTVTVTQLLASKTFPLINDDKRRKNKKYENSGVLQLGRAEIVKNFTFIDFLKGGCEIGLITAIDFTGSNGNPATPTSLHYFNPAQPNEYVQAISAIGDILVYYDSDKLVPVYGFGAQLPSGDVSHCFALNGNPSNPEVSGVPGILEVYQKALTTVQLYGPTLFTEVLKAAKFIAGSSPPGSLKYHVLLIITDGAINDLNYTIDQVVEATDLPLSIVIVGVGSADFSSMKALDADDCPLKHSKTGKTAMRDIVQFVPFSKYKGRPEELARETLAEIPGQLVSFMKSRGIKPPMPINP